MSQPYLSQITMVAFNFAPQGFAACDGQVLPINQHQSLYALLGTMYGGDGRTTFALPDLRGRTPVHTGPTVQQGGKAGAENVSLTVAEMPSHTHAVSGTTDTANAPVAATRLFAGSTPNEIYHSSSSLVPLHAETVSNAGNGQGHDNMQPFLTINFVIALSGLFPSRN